MNLVRSIQIPCSQEKKVLACLQELGADRDLTDLASPVSGGMFKFGGEKELQSDQEVMGRVLPILCKVLLQVLSVGCDMITLPSTFKDRPSNTFLQ